MAKLGKPGEDGDERAVKAAVQEIRGDLTHYLRPIRESIAAMWGQ